jgi:hypothetical protein
MSPLERRARRVAVDALLEELAAERRRLYLRKTYGVRGAGLRDLKGEYESTRRRLAELSGIASGIAA